MSTTNDTTARLFVAAYPGGLVFADREREDAPGDYSSVGIMPWGGPGALRLWANPEADPVLVRRALHIVATYQARRGELEIISASGQTVRLGEGSASDPPPCETGARSARTEQQEGR